METPWDPIVVDLNFTMGLPGRAVGSMKTMATQFLLGTRAPKGVRQGGAQNRFDIIEDGIHETQRLTIDVS